MNELRLRLADLLERLSPRERVLLAGAALATVVIVLWLIATTLADRRETLAAQIAASRRDLEAMSGVRDSLLRLRAENDAVERKLASLGPDFSLFSHLEGVTRSTLSRERVAAMNPSSRDLAEGMKEESVELRLVGVSLRELVTFLYAVEKGEAPLLVSRMRLKKRFDTPHVFDATLVVARLRRAA
jgi:hypothetical protein